MWFIIKIGALAKAIKIWPAVILAARRTDNVIGRIICLTDSISTMNCDSAIGVPVGTKWARKCCVFFLRENNTKANQKGILSLRVNRSWAVMVNMYGTRPIRLNVRIIKKTASNILIFPKLLLFIIEAFISLSKYIRVLKKIEVIRLLRGFNFNIIGVIKTTSIVMKFILIKLLIGSKEENRLFIMVIFFFWELFLS